MTREVVDVAIVGAGPVGVLLSAELARHGVAAVTLEQRAEPGGGSRAVGVHATALAAMEASGATERLLAGARRVRVGEARRRGRSLGLVRFERLHTRHPYVATLPQPRTEAALAHTAAAWGAAPPRRGVRVRALVPRADRVELILADGATLEARVAVVAGGLRARDLLPLRARVLRYPDRYLMTDCADDGDDGDRAVVHLDPRGVLESFPLPDGRRRYVAWMPAGDLRPAGDRLREAVATRTGSDAAASAVAEATGFGVARSALPAMRAGRVLAVGDTAHEVSPIGGQGMNLGLLDAVTLAPLLSRWVRAETAGIVGPGRASAVPWEAITAWERRRRAAAGRSGRIAAVNTVLGRPAHAAGAAAVRAALASPGALVLAHAYAMGFDPDARLFRTPR